MFFVKKGDNIQKIVAVFLPPFIYAFLKYFTFRFELEGLMP